MFDKYIARIAIYCLRNKRLSEEARSMCITALCDNLQTPVIRSIITFSSEGRIMVNGKALSADESISLRTGAETLNNSNARKLIRNQLKYEVYQLGIHRSLTPYDLIFSKAILYVMNQEDLLLKDILEGPSHRMG